MSRRFLAAIALLSLTIGLLIGLVVAGSFVLPPSTPVAGVVQPEAGPASDPRVRSFDSGHPAAMPAAATAPTPADVPPVAPVGQAPSGVMTSFADVAERVNPAVVNIDATSRGDGKPSMPLLPLTPGDPARPGTSELERDLPRRGAGTGFLISADGYILTNQHVVDPADRLNVRLAGGRTLSARRIGVDPDSDIALIKVDAAQSLPYARLGNSDRLRVGEWVVAIGNPLAFEHTVTVGIVSFMGRKLFNTSLDRYIQTDAAINFGNSGGPLINAGGEVIGINTAISSHASNIGFAVPINQAASILPQLMAQGYVSRGYIGIGPRDVDPDLQRSLRLPVASGALIQDLTPGAPAARAGLRAYDVVTAVDGRAVSHSDQFIELIASRRPGTVVRLQLLRDGRTISVPVKLAERPRAKAAVPPAEPDPPAVLRRSGPALGLSVRAMDREFAGRARLPAGMEGVVVSRVEPAGPAFEASIQRGQVLLEINRQPIRSVADYDRALARVRRGDALALYLYRPDVMQRVLQTIRLD